MSSLVESLLMAGARPFFLLYVTEFSTDLENILGVIGTQYDDFRLSLYHHHQYDTVLT
jgi:hypothetical protein